MVTKVYNTLTKMLEEIKQKQIKMFVCGPTVYNDAHLGHAKTYVQFDIIVKYLRYKKFQVNYIQNITDIDDKIIIKANENKIPWKNIRDKYKNSYLEDMGYLKVTSVNKYIKATDNIKGIISQVERLIKKGYAYKTSDGYYFDLKKFKEYGKLSGRTNLEDNDSISRIDESSEKRNSGDFCLWKFKKENEPFWKSKIGDGRPGWHIEDTAITEKYLGTQYDIHGGGIDLIFPHHEAEIAQMEAISGKKPFVKYWMHTGFLNINKEKMSKSLGNFMTIKEALKKYNPEVLRIFFASTHYRKPIDLTEENLENSKKTLEKLTDFKLKNTKSTTKDNKTSILIKKAKANFEKAMDNDFDTHNALNSILGFTKEVNKLTNKDSKKINIFLNEINSLFNIFPKQKKIPKDILLLAREREVARKNKDYKKSDELREKIKKLGYIIEDSKSGSIIKQ